MHIRKSLFEHYPALLGGSADDVAVGTVYKLQIVDTLKDWRIMKVPVTKASELIEGVFDLENWLKRRALVRGYTDLRLCLKIILRLSMYSTALF